MKRSFDISAASWISSPFKFSFVVMVSMGRLFLFGFGMVLFGGILPSSKAYGCASCGSGSGDPLILYPNEDYKIYGSMAVQSVEKEVSSGGRRAEVFGPTRKITALGSFGVRFSHDFFGTLTTGLQLNRRDTRTKSGILDPSLMVRYTALHQTFQNPWYPQIQGLLGYKHPVGTSIHSSKDKDLVDITSSGFRDFKLGIDLWYGMFDLKGGLAYLSMISLPRSEPDGSQNENGITHRWTGTLAHQFSESFKITGGINRQTTTERRYQNKKVPGSQIQDHSVFINLDFADDPLQALRFGYVRSALLPSDRLTTQTQTFSAAYLKTL